MTQRSDIYRITVWFLIRSATESVEHRQSFIFLYINEFGSTCKKWEIVGSVSGDWLIERASRVIQ
jgi:hypothetical protein